MLIRIFKICRENKSKKAKVKSIKYRIIGIAFVVFMAGCSAGGSAGNKNAAGAARIDTPEGMIEYLHRVQLPALKSVEVWENKYGPGLKLTTAHYEVYTTLLEPLMLSQVPGFMESCYRGYNSQLPAPVESMDKMTIYLFGQRQQWDDFTRDFTGPLAPMYMKIKAGAYYLNGACVAYNIGRERTFSALGHEGWHQFNKKYFKFRLPSWLDEGIATLFEASRESQGLFTFEPGGNMYRLGGLKQTLAANKMLPLGELIAINPGEVLTAQEGDIAVTAFYSQSYALVRFLREEGYGKRLGQYHQLMLDGLEGRWQISDENKRIAADRNIALTVRWNRAVGRQLFEKYISPDLAQIEDEYVPFCRKLVYHVRLR